MNDCCDTGFDTDNGFDTDLNTDYTDTGYSDSTAAAGISFDSDGDGVVDSTVFDFEGDGAADALDYVDPATGAEVLLLDSDGDGSLETAVVDSDGDGVFESGVFDSDGDGVLDTEFDPNLDTNLDPSLDPSLDQGADPFTPSADDDEVHGEPMATIPYHQAQVSDNDCLPTSVAMVLSEVTGTEVPQGDLVDLANELDLLGPDGMSVEGGVQLLEHYGVDAEVQTGDLDDLRSMLDAGRPVIIGLDADDLYGAGDGPFENDFVSGHAVVITGIDDEAGLVYINDPGFPDGAGVAIPIEDFEDAWTDGDHSMIVANSATNDEAGAELEGTADADAGKSLWDIVLIPITFILN